MAISPFPHTYTVRFDAGELGAAPREPIAAGAPPQFGGTDEVWSPEHLFVAATLLCLKTTFDAFARREQLAVHAWRGSGTATLVKGREGPVFTSIDLEVELETDPGDEARAQATLATAEKHCIISRAINVPVNLTAIVTAPATRAAS